MFKKILLPVDLEEESSWKDALPAALRMAKDDGAELHILTVVPPLPGQIYGYFPEDFEPKMIDQGKAAIEAFAKDHAGGTQVVPHLAQGQPYSAIIDLAEKIGADLIVMGSRGLGRLQSILSNSASQYVFQLSTRPMLLVRDDLYVRHINRVMVAIDGTGVGDDALKLACELVRDVPGSSLLGVHISRQDIAPSRGGQTPADELLDKAVQRARGFGVEMKAIHGTGDIGRGFCQAAEEHKADLVVIASQDRRPLVARGLVDIDRLLGSSVSDYIRVHAPAPVLLVREPEGR